MEKHPFGPHDQTLPNYPVPPPYTITPDAPQVQEVVVQTVYTRPPPVGPHPMSTECPSCRQVINTRLNYETSTKTHLMAALLCILGCCPCAWFPYIMDSCKNANHYCPNCSAYIGTYSA